MSAGATMLGGTIKLNPVGLVIVGGALTLALIYYVSSHGISRDSSSNTVNIKTLLIESIIAAEKGGFQVKFVHDTLSLDAKSKGKTKEGANDPVTAADLKSHFAILSSLEQSLGKDHVKIISEEHTFPDGDVPIEPFNHEPRLSEVHQLSDSETVNVDDVVIWVDPLDATQEYTESLLQYVTVMVCVAIRGVPVVGVIHKPFEKETIWAWAGHAMSSNLKKDYTSPKTEDAVDRIIVSRSHAGMVESVVKDAFGPKTKVIPAGGAGYKVLKVISGDVDAYVHVTRIKKWDICAGSALLNTVGGRLTTLKGQIIEYGAGSGDVNDDGLLATLNNRDKYLKTFQKMNKSANK